MTDRTKMLSFPSLFSHLDSRIKADESVVTYWHLQVERAKRAGDADEAIRAQVSHFAFEARVAVLKAFRETMEIVEDNTPYPEEEEHGDKIAPVISLD